jgi:HemK-like putative methylase
MTRDEAWLLKEKYNGIESEAFLADCARLSEGEPLAYVIGHIPFLNTEIFLESHPLIPRTETEFWVEEALKGIGKEKPARVLDLCAGTGCIGVAVLKSLPLAHVDFGEVDENHHETIRKNIRENDIESSRTHIYGGDLFQNLHGQYDFILSNPPYIDPILDRTAESVTNHEPHQALFGGVLGMEFIERIIVESPKFLNTPGVLYIEHEPEQVERIHELAGLHGFTVTTMKDQYGTLRFSRLLTGAVQVV